MQPLQTLSDFIQSTDASCHLFDMGRRVSTLSGASFQRFEQAQTPYPLPYLQQAWIAVLLWNPDQPLQQVIWFLKLPLDEQGLLVQAARDDFLRRLLRSVGDQGLEQLAEQDPLKDNPFAFTPDPGKMAAFHAQAGLLLKQPASAFYQPGRDYLSGLRGYDNWQALGLQGIADICSRLSHDSNAAVLSRAIEHLPLAPLEAFAAQLEHLPPPEPISQALSRRLELSLAADDCGPVTLAALLRGLSLSHSEALRQDALRKILASRFAPELEVLAATAGRCWQDLREPDLCNAFLEALARNSAGQSGFNQILAELLFIPGMRSHIMTGLRNPERSDILAGALGGFFAQARGA
ncbi:MAG: hypothetical protein ACJAWL_003644 [Motiliproteus sp.]|jgi:hypothetical protein